MAIARIKAGETERQKILLSARESEAARRRRPQAEQARSEAQNAQAQVPQAQAESQRLAAQLENMQASQTPRGIVLTLDDVLFDTGKAQLKPGAQRSIEQIAAFLNENPERRVQVEGFTDSQGANEYNLELSQSRADAVAMAIIQRGIDAQRVRALGYGEGVPGGQQCQRRQPPAQSSRGDHRLQRRCRDSGPRGRGAVKGETSIRRISARALAAAGPSRRCAALDDCALRLIGNSPGMQKVRELICARRAHRFDGADLRRERLRQGAGRRIHARHEPAGRTSPSSPSTAPPSRRR